MINLSVNNESLQIEAEKPLSEALKTWGYGNDKIAVAINGDFVPRSAYAERRLDNGDKLDIVRPVGGG